MAESNYDLFIRSTSRWPENESELTALAASAQGVLNTRFVGIVSSLPETRIGISAGRVVSLTSIQMQLAREFIKKQVDKIALSPNHSVEKAYVFEIDSAAVQAFSPGVHHLAALPITADLRVQPGFGAGVSAERKRQIFGWALVAVDGPLEVAGELALGMVAQRLSKLAGIEFLESQLQEGSQFLSIASHELKTPLTAIYGLLQLQERMLRKGQASGMVPKLPEGTLPETYHSYLKMVIRQVERLNELIDGLLDISRIQNGRFRIEPIDSDVSSTLREVVGGRLSIIAQEAGVKLQLEAPAALSARVDVVRVEEVFTNLIMNALRFSPEGGLVAVRLRNEDGAFRLMVRDQGPPIAPDDRERIFRPFERAQRTHRLGGLGLGLFISRQIAQLHGGNVDLVESVPGKGNLFEAYFPNRAVSQPVSA